MMQFRKWLPGKTFVLITNLAEKEVLQRLSGCMQPKTLFSLVTTPQRNSDKPYEGSVSGNSFRINEIIHGRNASFAPIAAGTIEATAKGTKIRATMQPEPFAMVFMAVWFSLSGCICAGMLLAGIVRFKEIIHHGFPPVLLIPFGMFIIGFIAMAGTFKNYSDRTVQFLEKLLDAQEPGDNI